jgi:Cys-tRNA(Pro) deacylase
MATRGIEQLKKAGVTFEVLPYRHEVKGAKFAAQALGLREETVLKTLVFQADDHAFLLILMSADGTVSEKKLAKISSHKRVRPAAPRDAQRITGYQIGGIGPFGLKRPLPVFLDEKTAQHEEIVINAGARGTMIRLSTADLIRLTGAMVADIRAE